MVFVFWTVYHFRLEKIKEIDYQIKQTYPEFRRSYPFEKFERLLKKSDAKYLLKYDKVKVRTPFLRRIKVYSIDISSKAIDFARIGTYAIHPLADDGFLLNPNCEQNKQFLSRIFHKNFIEIDKPSYPINNVSDLIYTITFDNVNLFPQRYFIPKESFKENISFVKGDINNIESFNNQQKAGAIFFRNAFYQLTNNNLSGVFKYGDKPNLETNKRKIIQELIDKIYNKLKMNGIFVLGRHLQEHLYIADRTVPLKDTIIVNKARNIRFMTNHPIIEALNKNGRFKPLFEFLIHGLSNNSLKIPLIWQKIK